MRILVTGAAGFIGRGVVAALARSGHQVTGTDVAGAPGIVALDLRDRAGVAAVVAAHRPDLVVHAGAISGGMLAGDDPTLMFDVNVTGTLNLAEAMRGCGVRRLVFLSSNAVYADAPTRAPVAEDAALGADEPYGASKIAAEAILSAYAGRHGLEVIALRVSSVFGAGRTTPYLMSDILRAARTGQPLLVTDRRSNMRQFVHVSDVVRAIELAVNTPVAGIVPVNVSGGTYCSEEEIVRMVPGFDLGLIEVVADKGRCDDGCIGPLLLDRAKDLLGYAPKASLARELSVLIRLRATANHASDLHERQ